MNRRQLFLLFIMIAFVMILLITTVIVSFKRYRTELLSQDWYEDFYYKFQSTECPHVKRIKLSETNWTFLFSLKRERSKTVQKGLVSTKTRQVHFRFYCEECGKQRWFEQSNSTMEMKGLYSLRLKYLLLAGISIMLILILTNKIFTRLL